MDGVTVTIINFPWGKRLDFIAGRESGKIPFPGLQLGSYGLDDLLALLDAPEEAREMFSRRERIFLQAGGWQSWSPGWELARGETLPRKVRFVPDLILMTRGPGASPARGETVGHFITYFRAGDAFLCLASGEGDGLPPLSFRINRKSLDITLESYCPGGAFKPGETIARMNLFLIKGFFALKAQLKALYAQDFSSLEFLLPRDEGRGAKAKLPGGYESWYNHYTDINEELLLRDLKALGETENLLKLRYLDRGSPVVFQIDDGWERAVGDWEVDERRFSGGLAPLSARIREAGFIPGLWLAPFVVTRGARVFTEKPDWLLRDEKGRLVHAGWNPNWSGTFYCLDISHPQVLDYLAGLMEKAAGDWGFRYLKLDFLYAGLFYGAFREGGRPDEHYRRACGVLTGAVTARGGACLGCGVPFGPSYRYFPLSRTGADTRETWDWTTAQLMGHTGRPSAHLSLRDVSGRAFMEGSIFLADPDVIFLRSKNCALTETEKELIALVNFLLGGQIMFSDDPGELSQGDLAFTRRIAGLYDALEGDEYGALRLDASRRGKAPDAYRLFSSSGRTAGLINLESRPVSIKRDAYPSLFSFLSVSRLLTDHRLRSGPGEMVFAPRSITVGSAGER